MKGKVVLIPDTVTLNELAEILNNYPEGYTFYIYEFDENTDFEG